MNEYEVTFINGDVVEIEAWDAGSRRGNCP